MSMAVISTMAVADMCAIVNPANAIVLKRYTRTSAGTGSSLPDGTHSARQNDIEYYTKLSALTRRVEQLGADWSAAKDLHEEFGGFYKTALDVTRPFLKNASAEAAAARDERRLAVDEQKAVTPYIERMQRDNRYIESAWKEAGNNERVAHDALRAATKELEAFKTSYVDALMSAARDMGNQIKQLDRVFDRKKKARVENVGLFEASKKASAEADAARDELRLAVDEQKATLRRIVMKEEKDNAALEIQLVAEKIIAEEKAKAEAQEKKRAEQAEKARLAEQERIAAGKKKQEDRSLKRRLQEAAGKCSSGELHPSLMRRLQEAEKLGAYV